MELSGGSLAQLGQGPGSHAQWQEGREKTKADLQGSSEATNVRQWDWSSTTQEDDVGSVAKRWPFANGRCEHLFH